MNARQITKEDIVDSQTWRLLVTGQHVDLKNGDEAILVRPLNWMHTEWIAAILTPENPDLVEYLNQ